MTIKKTDYGNVKKINRNAVYRYLYKKGAQSKQDIAYALHLSLPTVTQNINELIQLGLLMETGEFESTGGRKAKAIELVYSAKYAIGLDVTKNHIGVVIIDLGCNVIDFMRYRHPFKNTPAYFKEVSELITQSIVRSNIDTSKILGVGIGAPIIISSDHTTAVYGPVIDFTGGRLDQFSEHIEYPCVLCNDANAAGFAEIWHRGKEDNMIYVSLSNSVGGAILINGEICYGSNQRAGEVGHITVAPNGPTCYCGQIGCLDVVCNARILANMTDGNLNMFFEELEQDEEKLKVWNEYIDHLVLGINTLRMTLDSTIILGGYVGSYMDQFIDELREKVAQRNTFEEDGSYLDVCTYKFEATAVGAALRFVDAFMNDV